MSMQLETNLKPPLFRPLLPRGLMMRAIVGRAATQATHYIFSAYHATHAIHGLAACLRPMADHSAPSHASRYYTYYECIPLLNTVLHTSPPRHKRPQASPSPPHRKRHKPRPTHFLALQLSQHAAAVHAATTVQAAVTAAAPHLKMACVECSTLHVTLQVMAITDDDMLMRAIAALERCGQALDRDNLLTPVVLSLNGLGSFNDSVLFFKVASEPPDHLGGLARATRSVFAGVGRAHDRRPFTPHATVMKTSRMPGAGIAAALYEECAGLHVEPLSVSSLQLCSMARPTDAAYYPVIASLCLDVGEVVVGDEWALRFGSWRDVQVSSTSNIIHRYNQHRSECQSQQLVVYHRHRSASLCIPRLHPLSLSVLSVPSHSCIWRGCNACFKLLGASTRDWVHHHPMLPKSTQQSKYMCRHWH